MGAINNAILRVAGLFIESAVNDASLRVNGDWTKFEERRDAELKRIQDLLGQQGAVSDPMSIKLCLIAHGMIADMKKRRYRRDVTFEECVAILKVVESRAPKEALEAALEHLLSVKKRFSNWKADLNQVSTILYFLLGVGIPVLSMATYLFVFFRYELGGGINGVLENLGIYLLSPPYMLLFAVIGFSGGFMSVLLRVTATSELMGIPKITLATLATVRSIFGAMAAVVVVMMFQSQIFPEILAIKTDGLEEDQIKAKKLIFVCTLAFVAGFSERLFTQGVSKLESQATK